MSAAYSPCGLAPSVASAGASGLATKVMAAAGELEAGLEEKKRIL